ncbi:hypothetical protein [Lentibacter algarum]|uniref:hypothetical protein n=1 Tax=Lentibacter algarum TaxID=576131 RepID=UPI003BB21661
MTPKLLYNTHDFKALRYFEWVAIERLYAKPRGERMYNLYPDMQFEFWQDAHTEFSAQVKLSPKKRDAWIATDLGKVGPDKELNTLEKVYAYIDAQLKPKRRGKALKDDKRAIGQREYQREALGDAFVDRRSLVSAAKTACKVIAEKGGSPEAVHALIDQEASRLEKLHCEEALSDAQQQTLRDTIMRPVVEELMAVGVVERKLLESRDKQTYFLWGHIKAKCVIGDEIELGQATYKAWCGGNDEARKKYLTVLSDLKAIRVTWGKKGRGTRESTLVKRLV